MRITTIAFAGAVLGGANGFAPAPIAQRRTTLNLDNNNQNEDLAAGVEGTKAAVFSTVTAATLFMGSLLPIADVDVANAAAPATTTAPVATKTKATAAAKPAAPLSAEKAAVEAAKSAYAAAQKDVAVAKPPATAASQAYSKATNTREAAQKLQMDLKKELVKVNDKLAKAKSQKKNSSILDVYVKEIDSIKVSSDVLSCEHHIICAHNIWFSWSSSDAHSSFCFIIPNPNHKTKLSNAEKSIASAKSAETAASKELSAKQSTLSNAEKAANGASKSLADAENKLSSAEKKLTDAKVKAQEQAKKDKKKVPIYI